MRLFIAIEIPESVKDELENVSKELQRGVATLVKREAYHITLQFLGDVDDSNLGLVKESISNACRGVSPFEAEIKGLSHFGGHSPRVLFANVAKGSDMVNYIYSNISVELSKNRIDFAKEERYTPHVTIARIKSHQVSDEVHRLETEYSAQSFGSFDVTGVSLKGSVLSSNGPSHSLIYETKF